MPFEKLSLTHYDLGRANGRRLSSLPTALPATVQVLPPFASQSEPGPEEGSLNARQVTTLQGVVLLFTTRARITIIDSNSGKFGDGFSVLTARRCS